jgi:hypothetical protein
MAFRQNKEGVECLRGKKSSADCLEKVQAIKLSE